MPSNDGAIERTYRGVNIFVGYMLLILYILGSGVARLSFSIVAMRCLKSMEFVVLNFDTYIRVGWLGSPL